MRLGRGAKLSSWWHSLTGRAKGKNNRILSRNQMQHKIPHMVVISPVNYLLAYFDIAVFARAHAFEGSGLTAPNPLENSGLANPQPILATFPLKIPHASPLFS
jgi:hypothetical protein